MKFLICYNDHDNKQFHKTARITAPTSWQKSPSHEILKKFVKSYNAAMKRTNELELDNLHLALLDGSQYVPLPSDVPITSVVDDNTKLYIRHGKASTVAEVLLSKSLSNASAKSATAGGHHPMIKVGRSSESYGGGSPGGYYNTTTPNDEDYVAKKASSFGRDIEGNETEGRSGIDDEAETRDESIPDRLSRSPSPPPVDEPTSKTDSLIQFRRVLHSFGVDEALYDNFVRDAAKSAPDEKAVKLKLGQLLEANLKGTTTTTQSSDYGGFDNNKDETKRRSVSSPEAVLRGNSAVTESLSESLLRSESFCKRLFAKYDKYQAKNDRGKMNTERRSICNNNKGGQMFDETHGTTFDEFSVAAAEKVESQCDTLFFVGERLQQQIAYLGQAPKAAAKSLGQQLLRFGAE